MDHPLRVTNRRGLNLVADRRRPENVDHAPVVVFAHGWGSNRASPRNRAIAEEMVKARIGAFLLEFSGHLDREGDVERVAPEDHVNDLADAIGFLAAQQRVGPIGVAPPTSGASSRWSCAHRVSPYASPT